MAQFETMTAEPEVDSNRARLEYAINTAATLLPLPGPITAFAFLNTLQALEHLPFDEGLRQARLYGRQPYLAEQRYRDSLAQGRIRVEDIEAVLRENLGKDAETPVAGLTTRLELRLAMLQYPLRVGPPEEIRWFVLEADAYLWSD